MSKSSKDKKSKLRFIPFVGKKLAEKADKKAVVSVLRLSGVIKAGGGMKKGLNLEALEEVIEKAFEEKHLKAVALSINSPGGSPVQSALIAGRIREIAKEKDVPIFAFCEDAAASGGYWLACAGDEIYAHPSSIVGSIGVISGNFGFPAMLEKIGVERRVYTSGESKSQLDPFKAEKASDVKHLKSLLSDIHEQFMDYVRTRREGKLREEEKVLFSGSFWTGAKAADLGLVDGLGELRSVCRDKFGDETKFVEAEIEKSFLQRKLGLGAKISGLSMASVGEEILTSAEDRFWWSRIGL